MSEDFSEFADICQGLDYYVNNQIKMGIAPVMTSEFYTPPFASIFVAPVEARKKTTAK